MSVRHVSALAFLLLASVVVFPRAASSEDSANDGLDHSTRHAAGYPKNNSLDAGGGSIDPSDALTLRANTQGPRVYSLEELYKEKPTEAVCVQFRVLSSGTHHADSYGRVHDAESLPIILESTRPTGAEKGNYFKVVLVGDGPTAVGNLGLDTSHFSNRIVQATGVVRQIPEKRAVGRRVRYEIVIDNLKYLRIVREGHVKPEPDLGSGGR